MDHLKPSALCEIAFNKIFDSWFESRLLGNIIHVIDQAYAFCYARPSNVCYSLKLLLFPQQDMLKCDYYI